MTCINGCNEPGVYGTRYCRACFYTRRTARLQGLPVSSAKRGRKRIADCRVCGAAAHTRGYCLEHFKAYKAELAQKARV